MRIIYIIITGFFIGYSIGLFKSNLEKTETIEAQNKTIAESTAKLIKLDKQKRDLQFDNEYLREANEALLKYSEPKSCIKAIKKTPLPKMKG